MMLRSPDSRRISMSDDEETSLHNTSVDEHPDFRGTVVSQWMRVKWTDEMIRLLITTVSYLGDNPNFDCGLKRKLVVLQKKGKWKCVSKVMADRGFRVSPQQCEDKFNDLNKRYKKLNDMLGRGTSCEVVENPQLLDSITFLSDKAKDDVRKILSSKHLFYEEMCSYHNGNRLHLPHDPDLQQLLQVALRSGEDLDEDETDECDDFGDNRVCLGNLSAVGNCPSSAQKHGGSVERGLVIGENEKSGMSHDQWIEYRTIEINEKRHRIQSQMVELQKQSCEWQELHSKKTHKLDLMRIENERIKLENEKMALKLKRRETVSDYASSLSF